jgi:hypothetical protein
MDGSGIARVFRHIDAGRTRRTALTTALGGVVLAATGAASRSPETVAKKKKRCQCKAKAVGEICTSNKQCCTNQTNHICAVLQGQNQLRCCGGLGAKCPTVGGCCAGFNCLSGRCVIL